MSKDFYEALKARRSIYGIDKQVSVSKEKVEEIVKTAVLHTPSAFNSQSSRVVILFDHNHDKLWDITMEALRKVVPPDQFASTEERINSFKNGYGTLLFFEDQDTVESLQKSYPAYSHNFPIWSQQASGMHQLVIWTALEMDGLGVSLQHYNELIEEETKDFWKISKTWKMIGQMPFGNPTAPAGEKEFLPIEERVIIPE